MRSGVSRRRSARARALGSVENRDLLLGDRIAIIERSKSRVGRGRSAL